MKSTKEERQEQAPPAVAGWHRRWAAWMQRKSERLSRSSKITIWFLFCIAAGGYSGWLLNKGLTGAALPIFSIEPIKTPQHTGKTGDAPLATISAQEYQRIHRFKNYMDSLARAPSGRQLYDSLTRARPWLMDSVETIEALYHRQKMQQEGAVAPAAGNP